MAANSSPPTPGSAPAPGSKGINEPRASASGASAPGITTGSNSAPANHTPRLPPRPSQLGFLLVPPFRIQGLSVAGEETAIQIPELDVCFDIGRCPRAALASKFVALSHGHMDHAAGIAYYFSQRYFQGMGVGTVICHPKVAPAVQGVMQSWVNLENQKTPYEIISLGPDAEVEIKNHIYLRGFETAHTVPSLGFVVVEKRSKLLPELVGLPQEQLIQLKKQGKSITQSIEVPLVCYTGDTMWGSFFDRPDVRQARVLITECTFLEPGHKPRAAVGMHLHLDDIVQLLKHCQAEAIILTHLSRRTLLAQARSWLEQAIPADQKHRVLMLMDHRANRQRYEQQLAEAQHPAPPMDLEG
ncbi:MAG: MBL fold metallo-hydrolase [Phycisphaeraceae bacterium]|nr:MBL fold metallo-hydrolase [Phycisphaeraceae bacterium]